MHALLHQETTWEGHSTIIDELKTQLEEMGEGIPAAVVTSVGGGGLAMGGNELWPVLARYIC